MAEPEHAIQYGPHTEKTCPFWRYDNGGRCLVEGIVCRFGVGEDHVPEDCPLPIKVRLIVEDRK